MKSRTVSRMRSWWSEKEKSMAGGKFSMGERIAEIRRREECSPQEAQRKGGGRVVNFLMRALIPPLRASKKRWLSGRDDNFEAGCMGPAELEVTRPEKPRALHSRDR